MSRKLTLGLFVFGLGLATIDAVRVHADARTSYASAWSQDGTGIPPRPMQDGTGIPPRPEGFIVQDGTGIPPRPMQDGTGIPPRP